MGQGLCCVCPGQFLCNVFPKLKQEFCSSQVPSCVQGPLENLQCQLLSAPLSPAPGAGTCREPCLGGKGGSELSGCVVTWAVCKGARRAKGEMEMGSGTAGRGGGAAPGAALAGCGAAEPLRRAGLGDAAPRLAADGGPCPAPPSLDPSSQGDEGGFIRFASRCCSEALPQERSALPRSPRRQRAPRRHGVRPCPQPRPGASSQGAGQRGGF